MLMNRREFLAASVAGAAMLKRGATAFTAPEEKIKIEIDAAKAGEPITPLIFGGYMEPATTRAWAEMLSDRKFYQPISSATPPTQSFFLRFQHPWKPVGPDGTVEVDQVQPFVGAHSPRIQLAGSEPRGIQQSGMPMGSGRAYEGSAYLAGDPGAKVEARLVGETSAGDSQTTASSKLRSNVKSRQEQLHPFFSASSLRIAAP